MKDKLKKLLKNPNDLKIANQIIDLINKDYKVLFVGLIGSHAHGTNTPKSDIDFKIIYSAPAELFSGVRKQYHGISILRKEEDRLKLSPDFLKNNNDKVFTIDNPELELLLKNNITHTIKYERVDKDELEFDCEAMEIGHFANQLKKSNSNILELLFLPDDAMIYISSGFQTLIDNRDKFITLESKDSFLRYTYQQIEKMLNQNRKFNYDPEEMKIRKSPLDFIKVFEGKKEKPLTKWLDENNLNQKFCGIVHIPHNHKKMMDFTKHHGKSIDVWYMLSFHLSKQLQLLSAAGHNNNLKNQKKSQYKYTLIYSLFYDRNADKRFGEEGLSEATILELKKKYKGTFKGYKGIIKEDIDGTLTSNQLRVSSIPKDETLLVILAYDQNGYSEYCKDYKNYWDWVDKRNPERYKINKGHGQGMDSKNASHSIRIIETYLEVIEEGRLRIKRPERVQYYIDVKLGKIPILDILDRCNRLKAEIEELYKINEMGLPEKIDPEFINSLLSQIRE